MNRSAMLDLVRTREAPFDVIVIGGGASGAGCALDAAARGFDVLLLEQDDFGKGTSSRSTKLVHGGVRYLEQGDIPLVREALRERRLLRRNAPHLVREQSFVVPCRGLFQKFYYGLGLKLYDLLAGRSGFPRSKLLSREETRRRLPNLQKEGLSGGVLYYDGRFDDTRLLLALLGTAAAQGACLLNYARVYGLSKDGEGRIDGVGFEDRVSGELFKVGARAVINATGAFADEVRRLSDREAAKMISPSQGTHLVFDERFLGGPDALMIPRTSDGRVLFLIPWNGRTLAGTTDTPVERVDLEPVPLEEEIDFILETCRENLADPPGRGDVLSVFAGIRPLIGPAGTKNTARLSRGHTLEVDGAGLITLTGGKWTTYRNMAEDAVDRAVRIGGLPDAECVTGDLSIDSGREERIGAIIAEDPALAEPLHADHPDPKAAVVHAVRHEMAVTLEDVLARRTRLLFTDAAAALAVAAETARLMAAELDRGEEWIREQVREFEALARNYKPGAPATRRP